MLGRAFAQSVLVSGVLGAIFLLLSCGGSTQEPIPVADVGVTAACQATTGFSTTGENPYFPLKPGQERRYEGRDGGAPVVLNIQTLEETEVVAGIDTRVVEERETQNGELIEVSRNFFAAAPDGTVCYFGEDVDIYEGGEIVSHEGSWRAGDASAVPGIIMPGQPAVGQRYDQERASGVAQDHAEVLSTSDSLTVPAGNFSDVLKTRETTPLEPGLEEFKWYAPNGGLIKDGILELVETP